MAACRTKATEALKTILTLMRSGHKDNVRFHAAAYVIERAYGKPVQPSESARNPLEEVATETLLEIVDFFEEQRDAREAEALGTHEIANPLSR